MPKNELSLSVQTRVKERAQFCGNKAANLQELAELCHLEPMVTIPAFHAIDDQRVKTHLNRYAPEWQAIWVAFQVEQGEEKKELKESAKVILSKLRELIRETFNEYPIEDPELIQFLNARQIAQDMVIARSTGEGEDKVEAANPGGNESVASLPDIKSVSRAIGKVCGSYFSEKSLKQRLLSPQNDITHSAFMPVLMQRMIGEPVNGFRYSYPIVRSGVMYTGEAITRIQVAPGLGELVVNSKGSFDTFSVTRECVIYPEIARKLYRLVPVEQGVELIKNPRALQESASLPPKVVLRLASIGHKIEHHYGVPMDVEFVYDPTLDEINLVQARAITLGEAGIIKPSSVPPAKIPELTRNIQQGKIQKFEAMVIAPAGFAAKIITTSEQLFLCENISEALDHYLEQKESPLEAVIVRNRPPSSSHEAAQFNSKAIVVVQMDSLTKMHAGLSREKFTLLIDPQRNQLLDLSLIVQQPGQARLELEQAGFLESGLFTLPVTAITPLPIGFSKRQAHSHFSPLIGDLIRNDQPAALRLLFSKLNSLRSINSYTQCIQQLEIIEAATATEEALVALNSLRFIFYRLAAVEKGMQIIFQQAMLSCEEIERSLMRYPVDEKELREEHLTLVSKLKSLITYEGHSEIFSDSIRQIFQEKKSLKRVHGIGAEQLSQEQGNYLAQFLKLSKIAFNNETKQHWTQFALECVDNKGSIQKLASLLKFYLEHHMESQFINHDFRQYLGQGMPSSEVLERMYETCIKTKQELATIRIDEKKSKILAWERLIQNWGNPGQFDALWCDFEKEILPLIHQLRLDEPCDLIVLPKLPDEEALKNIPGEANWVMVMTSDKHVYMVNKEKQEYEQIDRISTNILFSFKQYFHLRLEKNRPHSLTSCELNYITSFMKHDHMRKLSIHTTAKALERFEMFELVQTDLAYIISDENLYFINKLRGTCCLSQMSLKEQTNFKRTLKLVLGKKSSVLTCFESLKSWSCLSPNYILKDYDYIPTRFNTLTQKTILSTVLDLTNLIDKIIKSTKSSPDYPDKLLLVRRFFTLLKPYHTLMQNWLSTIPDYKFAAWSAEIFFHDSAENGKMGMLHQIIEAFKLKLDEKELSPSGTLSIATAKIGSTGSFSRQFKPYEVTLEDLFSLMHQNLLSAISILSHANEIPIEYLPEALAPLFQAFQQGATPKLELLNISHQYPILTFEYNLPLRNHSASYTINYNQQNERITFHGYIFGRDTSNRMEVIADVIQVEGPLFNFEIKKEPTYSSRAETIEFTWEFHAERIPDIASTLLEAIQHYGRLTYEADQIGDLRANYPHYLFSVKRRHPEPGLTAEQIKVENESFGTNVLNH